MAGTITVSTSAQLYAAVKNATGDTTIVMKAGNYGDLDLYPHQNPSITSASGSITFVSEDKNNPATLTGLQLEGAKNITFDGIKFDFTAAPKADISTKDFRIEECTNVTIENSVFDGDDAKGFGNYNDGYGTGTALFVRGSTDVTVHNSTVTNFYRGIVVFESKDIAITDNEIKGQSSDGMNFAQVTDLLIEGNYIHDFESAPNTLAHKDMIQFWTTNTTSATARVVIRDNIFDSGSGVATQTLAFFNDKYGKGYQDPKLFYRDITVENNVIRNAHKHGITFQNAVDIKIDNNTLVQNADQGKEGGLYVPIINLWGSITNASVTDNVVHGIEGSGYKASGNYFIQRGAEAQEGYYGDLFINALSDNDGTWDDLSIAPGGYLQTHGLGSDLLYFDTTPAKVTPLFLHEAGNNLQLGHYGFDVSKIYGPSGQISTTGATVVWNFGDGKTGTGLVTDHSYAKPGTYSVTGTITLSSGDKITVQKTVEAETPVAFLSDMSDRGADQSGFVNGATVQGGVTFVTDGGSTAAKLAANARIVYTDNREFHDNTEFTVLVDYRKDQVADRGKLISYLGSFVITVTEHTITASVITDKGTKILTKSYLPLEDTKWHKIAVTFSGESGTAGLYLDGKLIASATGLDGAIQEGIQGQKFIIGSSAADSFNGLVDNVAFLRGALTAAEIGNLASGDATLDNILKAHAVPISTPDEPDPVLDGAGSSDPDDYDHVVRGASGNNTLNGTAADDHISGFKGNDQLSGGNGNDYLDGGNGADTIYGGAGNDTIVFNSADKIVDGGAGSDVLAFRGGNVSATGVTLRNIEMFDLANNAIDVVAFTYKQIRDVTTGELRIMADDADTVRIDSSYDLTKLGQFTEDGQVYIRYAIGNESWGATFAIDADATLTVNDLIA